LRMRRMRGPAKIFWSAITFLYNNLQILYREDIDNIYKFTASVCQTQDSLT
jgi:hypothetical protein